MKYLKIFLSLCLIVILSGCNVNKKTENVKEVEFWTLQLSTFSPYINGVIKEYEAQHPDVKIKWIDVPFSEGEKRTLATVMSKKMPDLVNLNPDFSSTLFSRNALFDLKSLISQKDYDSYLEASWKPLSNNGQIYGIPWYITTSVTYYNKDILRKAGLTKTDIPENYFELKEFSQIVKQKTGKYAHMPTLSEGGNILKVFNKYSGVTYVNNLLYFNNDVNVQVLELYKYLYQNDLIPKESITLDHRSALEQFMSGEMAILLSGTNFLKTIKENSPDVYKNLGIMPQIIGSNGKSDFSMMNLVVLKKARYPKEAVDFALFLTNSENQLKFAKLAPVFPSSEEALRNEYFTNQDASLEQKVRRQGALQLNNSLVPIKVQQNQAQLNEILNGMVQTVMLNKQSVKDALKSAQKDWQDVHK